MLVDLVQVLTEDGIRLHAALEPAGAERTEGASQDHPPVDAWLCLHGTGSNFYAASTLAGLSPKLLAGGASVLRANTRGHDLLATGPSSGRLQGAAFERIDESPLDLNAWIGFLIERGFKRIGILGHSLGAVKAIFTLAANRPAAVVALVAVSPPRLSYSYFGQTPRAPAFRETFENASQLIAAGREDELLQIDFPLRYYVSAAGFVDRYGPAERYNVLKLLDRVSVPTLVTYGSSEVKDLAFRGMPDEVAELRTEQNQLQVAVIAGADHIYTACHDALAGRISAWLKRLAG
jgi:hypothetical protein